jgi:hypothetical protein
LILAGLFFLVSVISPALVEPPQPDKENTTLMEVRLQQHTDTSPASRIFNRREMPWLMISGLLFFAYLVSPNPFIEMVTLPLYDLFAPFVFSIILYIRLTGAVRVAGTSFRFIRGGALDAVLWLLGTCVLVAAALAINVTRNRLRWRKVKFDITSPTLRDKTFRRLLLNLYPLVYYPRSFRICADGVLVCGLHYLMAIPFTAVEKVSLERNPATDILIGSSAFLATSTKRLIRLNIKGARKPVYITPKKHAAFMMYIRIARSRKKRRKK